MSPSSTVWNTDVFVVFVPQRPVGNRGISCLLVWSFMGFVERKRNIKYRQTHPLRPLDPRAYQRAPFTSQYSCCALWIIIFMSPLPWTTHVLMHNSASIGLFAENLTAPPPPTGGVENPNKELSRFHLQGLWPTWTCQPWVHTDGGLVYTIDPRTSLISRNYCKACGFPAGLEPWCNLG